MTERSATPQGITTVEEHLASLDDAQTVADSRVLIAMMQGITGDEPRMWNVGTVGFGAYHTGTTAGARVTATFSGSIHGRTR